LAKRQWETGGSVFALLRRRGPESARMLEIAAQMAAISGATLTVAGPSDLTDSADFAAWISGFLEEHSVSLQTERAPAEPAALRQRMSSSIAGCWYSKRARTKIGPRNFARSSSH
jgi:hypothetical protein